MAIFQRGMERDEIRVLTDAMIASGERMSFASLGKRTVDKHSTGGVGDKITLPAPRWSPRSAWPFRN